MGFDILAKLMTFTPSDYKLCGYTSILVCNTVLR